MTSKKLFIMFSILISMVGTKASAYDVAVRNADGVNIYYNYINDETELEVTYRTSSYNDYSGGVDIPEEVTYKNRTKKVTSIGDHAFSKCSDLKSVKIPQSVTWIGDHAFFGCSSLTSITIPNSVISIEDHAFEDSGLTSVTIPNSMTYIGYRVFSYCKDLISVTIPNSVKNIDSSAFNGCSSLTSITIPNSVTNIGKSAFSQCSSLTSIAIPNSVTSIGDYAFSGCSGLTSITIPNSVTSIGQRAFYGWDLPEVISKIENPFSIDNSTFSENTFKNATLYVPQGTIDKYKSKEGWENFDNIKEGSPSSIVEIDNEGTKLIKRYTLDGSQIGSPRKGLNIIRMSNGKTKKVLM